MASSAPAKATIGISRAAAIIAGSPATISLNQFVSSAKPSPLGLIARSVYQRALSIQDANLVTLSAPIYSDNHRYSLPKIISLDRSRPVRDVSLPYTGAPR